MAKEKIKKRLTRIINKIKSIKNFPVFLLIGTVLLVVISIAIYIVFIKYAPVMIIEEKGYAIQGKEISRNLQNSNFDKVAKTIELIPVEEQETLYKKLSSYYVGGDKKRNINIQYPIYINGNAAILNVSEDVKLITTNYEEVEGYPDFTITDGKMYNQKDLTRADSNEYLFLKNSDNIYINVKEIKIMTNMNEYIIPVNSNINFTENYISYYEIKDNYLQYNVIKEIDKNDIFNINAEEDTFENLLRKLYIIDEEKVTQEKNTTKEPVKEEPEEPVEPEEPTEPQEPIEPTEPPEIQYIEPEVSCGNIDPAVYTARLEIKISDPVGAIKKGIEFTIERNGKTYQRRLVLNSGILVINGLMPDSKFKIFAKYTYTDEKGKIQTKEFYEEVFNTGTLAELEIINLNYENGDIYSNKIELKNMKIENNPIDEVLNGIAKIEINVNAVRYKLSTSQIKSLLRGEIITYQTSETVKSNSDISYEIAVYDKFGDELVTNKNTGNTRTAKQGPTVTVTPTKQETTEVTLSLKLNNHDNVELSNYRYAIYDGSGKKEQEGALNISQNELKLKGLDPNKYFIIQILGDYNAGDINGPQENIILGETKFTTLPISSLGYLIISDKNQQIKSDSNNIEISIDSEKTDNRLIEIINTIKVTLKSQYGDVIEKQLTQEEIATLQAGNSIPVLFGNLLTYTTYEIQIEASGKQGTIEENVGVNYEIREFTTLKKEVEVQIKNQFITGNMIDFDIRIYDKDGAILNNIARMEIRDSKEKLIFLEEIMTNQEYERKTYTELEANADYIISFYADQFNSGATDSTYESNHLIKTIEVYTEEGIRGSIGLTELARSPIGKNLADLSSEVKWYVYPNFNYTGVYGKTYDPNTETMTIAANRRCVYDLKNYKGEQVTMSFSARRTGTDNIYIQNAKTDKNRTRIRLTTSWQDYTFTCVVDESGYLGFFGTGGFQIRNLQIELGSKKTAYEPFRYNQQATMSIDLVDKRDEITTNDYYVKIYQNNDLYKTERYEEIDENNLVKNALKKYIIEDYFSYKVDLVIKIRNREYVLDSQSFVTENGTEIKGINSKEEYLELQPNGNYIVLTDLDLSTGVGYFGYDSATAISFNGTIDFNGHSVYKTTGSILFYRIGKTGILKNLVFNVNLNNTLEMSYWGLFYSNYGTIENLQMNLIGCTDLPNQTVGLLGYVNQASGVITNFVLNLQVSFNCAKNASAFVYYNYGTIKNGYACGEPINATHSISAGTARAIGVIAIYSYYNATMENIYSLVNVNVAGQDNVTKNVANVINTNQHNSTIRNIYSVGAGTGYSLTYGPTICSSGNNNLLNIYYFTDEIFNNTLNQKTTSLALKDTTFQNQILNSEGAFNVDSMITLGYYPQVNMPDVMPRQDYIELPATRDEDLADILSIEVLEKHNDSAKVKFSVNNPAGENITKIEVQNIDVRLESQNFAEGKSDVIATLYNPIKYVSIYNVISITTKGAYNLPYTREFELKERTIKIDFYREINSIADWKSINTSPAENYALMTDLDFANEGTQIIITKTFSGKIAGNNHTIKNIYIDKRTGLFAYMTRATLENLFVQNLNIGSINGTYIGLVAYCNNTTMNNVHVTGINFEVLPNRTSAIYVGGICGYIYTGSIVTNCSVKDFNFYSEAEILDMRVGGMFGYTYIVSIDNSFTSNVNINVKNAITVNGVGGMVGYGAYTYIDSCYAAIGKIKSNFGPAGGLSGCVTTSSYIQNCYSMINISSEGNNIGGINGTGNNPMNCLAIGNVFTSSKTTAISRILGTVGAKNNNYAYDKQSIDGYITSELKDATELLTNTQLLTQTTYIDLLKWERGYNYDGLVSGILPKLYNVQGTELLPNQQDIKLQVASQINITDVSYEKKIDKVVARVEINNPTEATITEVQIDDMDTVIVKNINQDGKAYVDLTAKPNRFYDAYKISKIVYSENGETKEQEVEVKIDAQFYKEIYDFQGWQAIEEDTYQNYILKNDIDFAGKDDIKTNVTIGRLETDGTAKTLKNINIVNSNANEGFIKKTSKKIENINFEDINITTNKSGNYCGVIAKTEGSTNNLNFTRVTIDAKKMSYVACIAVNSSTVTDVTLKEIKCYGASYVGGFVGSGSSAKNLTANDIEVIGTGNYVGGIVGLNASTVSTLVTISDVNVTGNNQVGGYGGQSYPALTLNAERITVNGNQNVGGICGLKYSANITMNKIKDSTITGKMGNIGGFAGHDNGGASSGTKIVQNCKITGTTTTANYVGGIFGNSSGSSVNGNQVIDCEITSQGSQVGGIFGYTMAATYTSSFSVVENTEIEGYSNVGGITGMQRGGRIYDSYCNADIRANGFNAGGMVGYLRNADMTALNENSGILRSYVAGTRVTATTNAGGLIGKTDEDLYRPDLYSRNIFVEADVTASDDSASIFIGADKTKNNQLVNTFAYKYSRVNGEFINGENDNVTESQLLTLSDLSVKTTYTDTKKIGLHATYFNYGVLANMKYPTLKVSGYTMIGAGVDLPEDIMMLSMASPLMMRRSMFARSNFLIQQEESEEEQIRKLPNIEAYAISESEINIDFDKVEEGTYFSYSIGDEVQKTDILNKTYTFKYDFNSEIEITIGKNNVTKTVNISPSNVKRKVSIANNKYAYLKETELIINGASQEGEFINLYKGKALRKDGYVYIIESGEIVAGNITKFELEETKPRESYIYNGNPIELYGRYSIVNGNLKKQIYIVKSGKLSVIDGTVDLKIAQEIIDHYNENDVQTVLGTDEMLYNIKSSIKHPSTFKNEGIKEIAVNLNEDKKEVILLYENDKILVFNYMTGEEVYNNDAKEDVSFIQYILDKISSAKQSFKTSKQYADSQDLQSRLESTPLENLKIDENSNSVQIINNSSIADRTDNNYITVYNGTTKQYEVYKEKELLESPEENIQSETDKIENQEALKDFYYKKKGIFKLTKNYGIVWILLSITAIIVILAILYRHNKNKQEA